MVVKSIAENHFIIPNVSPVSHCESGPQVLPVGEWVGVRGRTQGGGRRYCAEVVHVGRAHRESNLSTVRERKGEKMLL